MTPEPQPKQIPLSTGQRFRIKSPKINRLAMREIYTVKEIGESGGEYGRNFTAFVSNLKGEQIDSVVVTAFFAEAALVFYARRSELEIEPMEA